nr:helix-turn-helix transcriptional regulator [Nocardioides sp. TF02-7]
MRSSPRSSAGPRPATRPGRRSPRRTGSTPGSSWPPCGRPPRSCTAATTARCRSRSASTWPAGSRAPRSSRSRGRTTSRGAATRARWRTRPLRGLGHLVPRTPAAPGRDALTDRERQVLRLVAEGLTDAEIGQRLVISPHTVHRHVANARVKLGVRSRAAAAAAVLGDQR